MRFAPAVTFRPRPHDRFVWASLLGFMGTVIVTAGPTSYRVVGVAILVVGVGVFAHFSRLAFVVEHDRFVFRSLRGSRSVVLDGTTDVAVATHSVPGRHIETISVRHGDRKLLLSVRTLTLEQRSVLIDELVARTGKPLAYDSRPG